MYIKRYTIAALILMALVGGYVFSYITQETMSLDFFGIPLPPLSIALWVVVPLFILYIASVAHMLFYSIMSSLKLRRFEKDFQNLIDAIVDAYMGKRERHYSFKTERYKLLGALLENTTLFPKKELAGSTQSEKLNSALQTIENIKNAQIEDLKKYNLPIDNELTIQNERNRYKAEEISAEDILSNSSKYADVLCKEVYVDFVAKAPLHAIEKYQSFLSKEALYTILARVNADDFTLEISTETIISFLEKLDLSKDEYIKLSSILSTGGMIPEQRIKLFEMLSEKSDEIMDAYLFTLFDLEMLAPAEAILDNSQPSEYQNFKAYRALKECNQNFSIYLFV
ncbi:MAG: hypothetical protein JXQ67_04800 [Campylobacterales bacterium]|nr:hypothetical protein [Campylobacterales bacterium]